jgi:hypothetical protein
MPDTRKAILDQLVDWSLRPLDNDHPSYTDNIYWLYGIPGLGKTTVAHSLCHLLQEYQQLAGSYFCRRDDPVLHEPGHLLPTLIYRLAWMWPPYRKLVVKEIRRNPQLNPYSSSNELFAKLLARVPRQPDHPLVFVIDALDECSSPIARSTILKSLKEACSAVNWLRIIIVSRPEQDLHIFFHPPDTPTLPLSYDLAQDEQTTEDLELFAKSRMRLVAEGNHLPPSWPSDDSISKLVAKADGLFLYVETVYLLIKDDAYPNGLLTNVLKDSSGDDISSLFKLYLTVLESKALRRKEEFRSTIGMILAVAVHRPLRDETIARLLSIEDHIVKTRVNRLGSLLYRDQSTNGGIRLRHLSILEFLTGTYCPAEYRIDIEQANLEVGRCCLKTMTKELKFNICNLETSLVPNDEVTDLGDRVKKQISDALQYSCVHWANHLWSTPNRQIQMEACSLIDRLFEGIKPLFWMEVLSVMKQVPAGISALRKVLMLVQVRVCVISWEFVKHEPSRT